VFTKQFVQAFIPLISLSDLSTVKSAALAGGSAALSAVMSLLSAQVGDKGTASAVSLSPHRDEV
jgi:hypothetical protein